MKWLSICLLANVILTTRTENDISYQMIELKNSPVIFENIGKAVFYKNVWTIFTKFKPMDFSSVLDIAEQYDQKIELLCSHIKKYQNSCKLMVKETEILSKNLRQNNEHILHIFTHRRPKRAINAIGRFSKWAFGTMDNNDAHKIYNKLIILGKHDEQSFEMMKHQITVMASNFEKFSTPIKNLTSDVELIAENLRELGTSYDNFSLHTNDEINKLKLKSEIYELLTIINSNLLEIENRQATELSILNDLFQNKLHPFILDENYVADYLKKLKLESRINPFFQKLFNIHQSAQVTSLPFGEEMLIKIIIPLPEPTVYSIHKTHALPTSLNEKWDLLLNTKYEYVAEADNHGTFITLTQEEHNKCVSVQVNTSAAVSVCKHNSPILTSGNTECLVELLQHSKTSEENCKYSAVPASGGIMVKMVSSNQWLFKLKNKLILNVNCDGIYYTATLSNTGILKLLKPCDFSNKEIRIPYEKAEITETWYKQPEVDHSELLDVLKRNFTSTNVTINHRLPLKIGNHDQIMTSLAEGKKSLDELQKEWDIADKSRRIENQDWEISIHRYSIISVGTLVTILVIIGLVIYVLKSRKSNVENKPAIQLTTITTGTNVAEESSCQRRDAPKPPLSRNASRKSIKRPNDLTFACI